MAIILLVKIGDEIHPLTVSRHPIILGRSERCNVRFSDSMMSSRHCEIRLVENHRVEVKDLNSSNGTFLNDSKIEAGHVFIGDTLKVGNITMSIDVNKLTKLERKALTDESVKRKKRFVSLKKKKKGKTILIKDFTQINLAIPNDLKMHGNESTYIMDKEDVDSARRSVTKSHSKKKNKIIKKDKTGFFKKIFKGFRENSD